MKNVQEAITTAGALKFNPAVEGFVGKCEEQLGSYMSLFRIPSKVVGFVTLLFSNMTNPIYRPDRQMRRLLKLDTNNFIEG